MNDQIADRETFSPAVADVLEALESVKNKPRLRSPIEVAKPRSAKPKPAASVKYDSIMRPLYDNLGRKERIAALNLYLKKCTTILNHELKANGLKVSFAHDGAIVRYINAKGAVQKLAEQVYHFNGDLIKAGGGVDGFSLFPDTIKFAVKLAKALLEREEDGTPANVSLEAETQFGKTIVLIMANILYTMLADDVNNEAVFLINPSRDAPHEQTGDDWTAALDLHSALYIKRPGMTQDDREAATLHGILDDVRVNDLENKIVVKRATEKQLKETIDSAFKAGMKIVTLIIDEADEAAGVNSVIKKCLTHAKTYKGRIAVRVLLCSATAYHFKEIDGFRRVVVKESDLDPNSTYCGTFIAGKKGARTPFVSQDQIDDELGLGGRLSSFDSRRINSSTDGDLEVIYETITAFANGINAPEYHLNGKPMNGGRGAMVRFGRIAHSERLVGLFRDRWHQQGIVTVEINSKQKSGGKKKVSERIEQELEKFVRDETLGTKYADHEMPSHEDLTAELTEEQRARMSQLRYIVFVHGAGRRADRFPTHTTVFLDFTYDFSSSTAAEQGTVGRASGHGKITDTQSTIVMLSERNYELLTAMREYYDRFKCKGVFKSAGPNTVKLEDENGNPITIKRKLVSRIIFDRRKWKTDAIMQSVFDDIEAAYKALLDWQPFRQKRTIEAHEWEGYRTANAHLNPTIVTKQMKGKELRQGAIRIEQDGRRLVMKSFDKIEEMVGLSPYLRLVRQQRRSCTKDKLGTIRLAEPRARKEVYFDLFGMLAKDNRFDYVQNLMRDYYGDPKLELMRAMPNSLDPGDTLPPEPPTNLQTEAEQVEYTRIRAALGQAHPKAVNAKGEFYQSNGGAIILTLNNLERKNDGTRTYDDPSQRDRDRNYRHLYKPPLFFVENGDTSQGELGRTDELVRFSMNTLRPFRAKSHLLAEARGIELSSSEQVTLPKDGTAYWDFTSLEQKVQVQDQSDRNAARRSRRK
jgi:hypothetical protein